MKKINGKKLDNVILAGHIQMMNWDLVEKSRKPNIILDNLAIILAISMMVYIAVR